MKNIINNRIQSWLLVALFAASIIALLVMVRGDEPSVAVPDTDSLTTETLL